MILLHPMIPAAGRKLVDSDDWAYELKHSGFRALLVLEGASIQFQSERGSDLTKRLPELAELRKGLKVRSVVLDGEVIAGNGNIASFRELVHRYAKFGITSLKPKEKIAVKYVAFDVLLVNGASLMREPLKMRQKRLKELVPGSGGLLRSKAVVGKGTELLQQAEKGGYGGVVGKRLDSIYEPGVRSRDWMTFKVKVKPEPDDEAKTRRKQPKKSKK